MSLRRKTINNYAIRKIDLGFGLLLIESYDKECPEDTLAYVLMEVTEDMVTFEKTYFITQWQSYYFDDWPVQVCFYLFIQDLFFLKTGDKIKVLRTDSCGFWEALPFQPLEDRITLCYTVIGTEDVC